MSKSKITIDIENALIKRFKGTSTRYATEVTVTSYINGKYTYGICDFVTANMNHKYGFHEITCFEIKISLSDFKSEHGHSLFGDFNYYVLTKELYFEIYKNHPNLLMGDFGIMAFNGDSIKIVRECSESPYRQIPTIEQRFKILDDILMRWHRGRINDNPIATI